MPLMCGRGEASQLTLVTDHLALPLDKDDQAFAPRTLCLRWRNARILP
jgi:hypothetical protein